MPLIVKLTSGLGRASWRDTAVHRGTRDVILIVSACVIGFLLGLVRAGAEAVTSPGLLCASAILWQSQLALTLKPEAPSDHGHGHNIGVRMLDDRIAALDAWIKKQKEPDLSRPEAIRRLVEIGLKAKVPK